MTKYTLLVKLNDNLDEDIIKYYRTYKPTHKEEIFLGKKANKYKNKSDANNQVKKNIYENTKNIVFKNCKSDNVLF